MHYAIKCYKGEYAFFHDPFGLPHWKNHLGDAYPYDNICEVYVVIAEQKKKDIINCLYGWEYEYIEINLHKAHKMKLTNNSFWEF